MPLPCPGPAAISFLDIQNEFEGSNPIELNEYYRNGGLVPSNNTSVPTSGTISLDNFFCAVNEIVVYITATTTNVNVQSLFGGYWTQNVPKRLIINPGVVVGGTNTISYALNIPSGFGGTVKIDNNGSIRGFGGYGGGTYYGNGGTNGGPAIFAGASGISIDNQGTIYGGGGGGGAGGYGGGGIYLSGFTIPRQVNYTTGGQGGTGGNGLGYLDTITTAPPYGATSLIYHGPKDGGINAGRGAVGGDGGARGSGGNPGLTGSNGIDESGSDPGWVTGKTGYNGGLAGYYIVNNANVTWTTLGTVAGRVG